MEAEAREAEPGSAGGDCAPPPVRLHPSLANLYRERVAELHLALADALCQAEALGLLRALIDKVVVRSADNGIELEIFGDLIAMINLGGEAQSERKKAALVRRLYLLPKSVR